MRMVEAVVMVLGRGRDHAALLDGTGRLRGPAMAVHEAVIVVFGIHGLSSFLVHFAIAG